MKKYIDKIQNKKVKKLFRDPKRFVYDSRLFQLFGRKQESNVQKTSQVSVPIVQANAETMVGVRGIKIAKVDVVNTSIGFLATRNEYQESTGLKLYNCNKPIIVLYNFSNWKWDFICGYLIDYQVVFLEDHVEHETVRKFLTEYPLKAFLVWGADTFPMIDELSVQYSVPIWRAEDGFIRSVKLGSELVPPKSLAIDRSGIYFDSRSVSDLEKLLNYWDIQNNTQLLLQAKQLMAWFRDLKISKYNDVDPLQDKLDDSSLSAAIDAKRVLVLGQLESDASIKYGGCDGWTNERLIGLAVNENPKTKILYRPHPDQLRQFPNHTGEILLAYPDVEIASHKESVADQLLSVSRVYTMTSLAGLEALLHGVSVTVVGAPFYAGWGLTDDRAIINKRFRTLTLEELFCIVYCVYPQYLSGVASPTLGVISTIQQIVSEREQDKYSKVQALLKKNDIKLLDTKYWSLMVLSNNQYKHTDKHKRAFVDKILYDQILKKTNSVFHNQVLTYLIAGAFESGPFLHGFLSSIAQHLDNENLSQLLTDMWAIRPSVARMEHWGAYCERLGNYEEARRAYEYLAGSVKLPTGWGPYDESAIKKVKKLATFELRNKNFEKAFDYYEKLLLSGCSDVDVLDGIAQIAINRFEYHLAYELYCIISLCDPKWQGWRAFLMRSRLAALLGNRTDAFISACMGCYNNPSQIALIPEDTGISNADCLSDIPFSKGVALLVHLNNKGGVLSRAHADISIGEYERAEQCLLAYKPTLSEEERYSELLSQAQGYLGKTDLASEMIRRSLVGSRSRVLYREAFRLASQSNNSEWLEKLITDAERKNIEVSEAYIRKAATIQGNEKLYYQCFRNMASSKLLERFLGKKYFKSLMDISPAEGEKVLVLAYFGPGDEIRWASLYPRMQKMAEPAQVVFSCDPRLYSLFSRSLPQCEFLPSKRTRNIKDMKDVEAIRQLPSFELFRHMDNVGWFAAESADYVTLQLDLLADVVADHKQLDGRHFLKAAPKLIDFWRRRLETGRKIGRQKVKRKRVGLCWRSSVQTTARNQYYLDMYDVESLIRAFPDIDFYCLQYDDCSDERHYLEQKLPGKLKYYDDLDYYNDFENLSALMVNLDLIISPGTTIVELAGALGVKTLYFTTTAEADWRYRENSNLDVWQSSIIHVKPEVLNSKSSMLSGIVKFLRAF